MNHAIHSTQAPSMSGGMMAGHTTAAPTMGHMHAAHTSSPTAMSHAGHTDTASSGDPMSHGGGASHGLFFKDEKTYDFILFESWRATNSFEYYWSLVGVLFMGFFFELLRKGVRPLALRTLRPSRESLVMIGEKTVTETTEPVGRLSVVHVVDTLLFGVQLTLGYLLMLVAMTYNVGLFSMVIVGATVGHFVAANPGREIEDEEDCCN